MGRTEPIRIKDVVVGAGAPKTIVSLMSPDVDGLLVEAQRAVSAGADCVEWRADYFSGVRDASLLAHVSRTLAEALPRTPLIFTLRSKSQGGRVEVGAEEYVSLTRPVIENGHPDLVDIELCAGDSNVRQLAQLAQAHDLHAIVSHHDFCGTPEVERMSGLLAHMASLGASIPKLATMAYGPLDTLRLMEATARAANELATPLLTIAMGSAGALSRLCGEVFGSALTFCALDTASAPGQVELGQARALVNTLHDVVCGARQ